MTLRGRPGEAPSWAGYLTRFHAERPGITERVLCRCRADGLDPYQWCAETLADRPGPVLDVACGSAPLAGHLAGWVGVDLSEAELRLARAHRRGPLMRASATRLPVRAGALGGAACSMSLQVIQPVGAALAEIARALQPGGRAAILLPANRPLPWRDALIYLRLQLALRRRVGYPNDRQLRRTALARCAAEVGLVVRSDERKGFLLPLRSRAEVDELVDSLYLPDLGPARAQAGGRVLARSLGRELTVPLRRVVLDARGPRPRAPVAPATALIRRR